LQSLSEMLQERVMKVLQVWADWFLFSDAYVNGLRATFLRPGNSGVIPFHSICGDAPEIEQKITSDDAVVGSKTDQDAALAMGRGAATRELMSLPLAELERRCRHNGLSLVGGREMMVARLLSLEEAEKQRGYELDDELKYPLNQPSSGKYSSSQRETSAEPEPMGLSGLNQYGDEDMQGKGFAPLAPTLPIPQPELKAFTKKEKNDLVLPASKWAREDDESDDEQGKGKNLGLSYSSSGSENVGDGLIKADESEAAADSSFPAHADSGMNEEQRLHYISFLDCHPFCSR
jgi:U2-associated protein SR140